MQCWKHRPRLANQREPIWRAGVRRLRELRRGQHGVQQAGQTGGAACRQRRKAGRGKRARWRWWTGWGRWRGEMRGPRVLVGERQSRARGTERASRSGRGDGQTPRAGKDTIEAHRRRRRRQRRVGLRAGQPWGRQQQRRIPCWRRAGAFPSGPSGQGARRWWQRWKGRRGRGRAAPGETITAPGETIAGRGVVVAGCQRGGGQAGGGTRRGTGAAHVMRH